MRPRVTAFPPTRATTLRLTNVVVLWYWAQHDIQPQDVFVVADLDELLSREFLAALKHCEVHPGMEQPGGQCSKVVALTFGHKVSVLLGAELASGVTVQTLPASTTAPVSQTEVWWGHGCGSTPSIALRSDRRGIITLTSPWASVFSSSGRRSCA